MTNGALEYGLPLGQLRAALNDIALQSLRPVSIGLGALYTIYAVSHYLLLPPATALPMAVAAAATTGRGS